MNKIKYRDLPEKTKTAIDKIIELRGNKKLNVIKESQLSWLIYYNIGTNKNFDTAYSPKNWIDVIKAYNLMSPDIEEELFPLIFSSPSE